MPLSSATALSFIVDGSAATPGLFNTLYSTLSQNFDQLNAGTFTSIVTAQSFAPSGGVFSAGRIYKDPTLGLVISATTGSAGDLYLVNATGAGIAHVPTGTASLVVDGPLTASSALSVTGTLSVTTILSTSQVPMMSLDTNSIIQIGGTSTAYAAVIRIAAASLAVGSAAMNGVVCVDSTNNRLIYYSGGNRYFIAGTSF